MPALAATVPDMEKGVGALVPWDSTGPGIFRYENLLKRIGQSLDFAEYRMTNELWEHGIVDKTSIRIVASEEGLTWRATVGYERRGKQPQESEAAS